MAGNSNDDSEERNRDLFSPGGGSPDSSPPPARQRPEDTKAPSEDVGKADPVAHVDAVSTSAPAPAPRDGTEPFPSHDDDPYRDGGTKDRSSILEHPALPWMAVALAFLVVMVVIVAGRGDDSASTKTPAPGTPPGSADASEPKKDCLDFSYGANLLGEPRVAGEPGVHLWQDVEGFHLRLVKGAGSVDAVSGTIRWTGEDLVLDPNDPAGATVADGQISFALDQDAQEVNFRASCKTESMTFDLKSNDSPLDPAIITVGRGDEKISANPLILTRGG